MADTTRTILTTLKEFLRGYETETLRNRILTALLMKRGRIKYGAGGLGPQWQVKFKQATIQGNDGTGTLTFSEQQRYKQAYLPYRGYAVVDSATKRTRVLNKGAEALVNIMETIVTNLTEDLEEQFGQEFYIDGNASGNEDRMHGVESFFGINGTLNVSTGAQRSANAADLVAYPDDSYATLDTDLGGYSGSQTTGTWPSGVATADYDFYTPVMVNYTSTGFAGSADTWAQQCLESMRYGINKARRNSGKKGALDLIVLDGDLYRQFLDKQDSKERINIENTEMRELGFGNMTQLDGVPITWEYGIPASINGSTGSQGYGFNVDYMELRSCQGQLFEPETGYDMSSRTERFVVDFIGNLICQSPRHFLKLAPYA